ncbi:Uncharacterised protein [Mycobacterium tuberculosis]|uniref:Uncharacterized protein n=1 Tax=Mycobacterium tuberculosis TaxID=1773 RepID=A0A0T7PU55_MYCTX|nr:Uncharacterised protein [Mycobacterium tuberculosis]COV09161.1 Uncharacterised protein [Mycobacterium tuberculosis]COX58304.1 Uncharacterised protein [Mycobacterium tuberculosis]CPA70110.1 Uncharacterised protein [Mycobacterium tuberculosis]CPB91786.1 Uncharacterised protein [Mycobacterium tuberculosis]
MNGTNRPATAKSAARALRNLRARIAVSYCIDACSRGVLRSIEMGLQ